MDANLAALLLPIISGTVVVFLFALRLNRKRSVGIVDDLGFLTAAATACYALFPLIQHIAIGGFYKPHSASQLFILAPTSVEIAALGWWYISYLVAFCVIYLLTTANELRASRRPPMPVAGAIVSFVFFLFVFWTVLLILELVYNIDLFGAYDTIKLDVSYEAYLGMPLWFRQFFGIVAHTGVLLILKIGLLLICFISWRRPASRWIVYIALIALVVRNTLWMGARTEMVILLTVSAIMYNQYVKKLSAWRVASISVALFVGFILIGLLRGAGNLREDVKNAESLRDDSDLVTAANNEFQALFAGNFDLLDMRNRRVMDDVPLQFRFYDLVMLVPAQFLPFDKLDVQLWYRMNSSNPGFFMLNPVSQSIIGFGLIEVIVRGGLLGWIFALIRSWYHRRSGGFWPTLTYIYLCAISYYTIRGAAFYFVAASLLFRLLPVYLAIRFLSETPFSSSHIRRRGPKLTSKSNHSRNNEIEISTAEK